MRTVNVKGESTVNSGRCTTEKTSPQPHTITTGWQDLLVLICEQFSQTLLSLWIGAASASRFTELIQAIIHHKIDPPESTLFFNEDLCYIAKCVPTLRPVTCSVQKDS